MSIPFDTTDIYEVINMGQLLNFVFMLQDERLNEYVTYLLLLSITLLGESNSSTEMGGN